MSDLTMQLPTELVERAVRDKINAAIASQLGDPEVLITKLVGAAMSQKVNQNGKRSNSSYENKYDFLEVIAGKFIQEAAEEALKEYLTEQAPLIKEAVKKSISQSPAKVAKILVDGLTDSMNSSYSSKFNITFESKKDY